MIPSISDIRLDIDPPIDLFGILINLHKLSFSAHIIIKKDFTFRAFVISNRIVLEHFMSIILTEMVYISHILNFLTMKVLHSVPDL